MSRTRKLVLACLIAPLVITALIAILIGLFGWNWARAPIGQYVEFRTGRSLVIAGDLSVQFSLPKASIQAAQITFANPRWAQQKQMATLPLLQLEVDLLKLFRQDYFVPVVTLVDPVISLERGANGSKNWLLDKDQTNSDSQFKIGLLKLIDGRITFTDKVDKTNIAIEVDSKKNTNTALVFKATGTYRSLPFIASGTGGQALALLDEAQPYPITFDFKANRTTIRGSGAIVGLAKLTRVDLRLNIAGDSLAQLYPIIGVGLPETRPYSVSGQLTNSKQAWNFDRFAAKVGQSDLSGSLSVDLLGNKPKLTGEVVSSSLLLADLGPPVGLQKKSTTVSSNNSDGATASQKILPDIPFNPSQWQTFDADVLFKANRIIRDDSIPIDTLKTRIVMENSVLTLRGLEFVSAGGKIVGNISLDGRAPKIKATARVDVQAVHLAQVLKNFALIQDEGGRINGKIDLTGAGNDVGTMLATANGGLRITIGSGRVSKLLVEKASLHVLEIIQLAIAGDKSISLNCAVADFAVANGDMVSRSLFVDTSASTFVGSGTVNLGREAISLVIRPKTKRTSLISLRSPILIAGTFAAPTAGLDTQKLIGRAAGALLLGAVNPILGLVPLIEQGPGLANQCPAELVTKSK